MTKKWWTLLLVTAFLFSLAALVACGDDDAEATDGDVTDGDDTDGDEVPEVANFRGFVIDFKSKVKLDGVKVYVLDNETGEKLSDVPVGTTDGTGYLEFTIPVPEGAGKDFKVGFLCEGVEDESVDTYQFNIGAFERDERLWLVDATTYMVAPLAAGVTLDPGTTVVAGGVYWVNAQDKEEIVDCATVNTDTGDADVRYFADNGMPADLPVRDSINPLNGFFIIANIDPGVVNVEGYMGAEKFGSTRLVAKPDSICISNIYAEGDQNPGGCN